MTNVFPIKHPVKTDLWYGFISSFQRGLVAVTPGTYGQHPAARRDNLPVLSRGARVESRRLSCLFYFFQPTNLFTGFISPRIAFRGQHNRTARLKSPFQLHFLQFPVHGGLENLCQIVLEEWKDALRFRIAESYVEFYYF